MNTYWSVSDYTGPWYKASLTYRAGLTHDPDNLELEDGLRRALDALNKIPIDDEEEELLWRVRTWSSGAY
jgi:hypothetical protein